MEQISEEENNFQMQNVNPVNTVSMNYSTTIIMNPRFQLSTFSRSKIEKVFSFKADEFKLSFKNQPKVRLFLRIGIPLISKQNLNGDPGQRKL